MMQNLSRFFSLFWLLLLVQSMYYPMVVAQPFEKNSSLITPTITAAPITDPFLYFADEPIAPPITTPNAGDIPVQGSPFVCRFSELTPQENANILDFVKKGQKLDEFIGTPNNADDLNEHLLQDTALVPDSKGEIALKQKFPNQLFRPDQAGFLLNRAGSGAFATGIVMQDTLRVGRCTDLQRQTSPQPIVPDTTPSVTTASGAAFEAMTDKSQRNLQGETCWVETPGLNYPNYDQEVLGRPGLAKVTNAVKIKDVITWRTDPVYQQSLGPDALNLIEAAAVTQANTDSLADADPASDSGVTAETVQRIPGNISNRWQTDDFTAKMQTPCQNSSCSIDVYSLFAKYFNSAASVSMVISNFGPTMYHEAGRLWGRAGKTKIFPFQDSYDTFKKRVSEALLGKNLAQNPVRFKQINDLYQKNPEFKTFMNDLTKGDPPTMFAIGGGEGKVFAALKADGSMTKYLDTPQKRREFTQLILQNKEILDTTNLQLKAVAAAYAGGEGSISKLEYAKRTMKILGELDEPNPPGIDFVPYFLKQPEFGLSDAYFYNVQTKTYQSISSTNVGALIKEQVSKDGVTDFAKLSERGIELTDNKAIKLFKIDPNATGNMVPITTVESYAKTQSGQYFIEIGGTATPLTEESLKNLTPNDAAPTGFYRVFQAKDKFKSYTTVRGEPRDLTMEEFGNVITEGDFAVSRFNNANVVMGKVVDTAKAQGLTSREYTSILDAQFASEKKLTESYFGFVDGKFVPTGPIQWTALPFVYDWFKKGFGNDAIALYQLPESYNELQIQNGTDPIYNDAYIDFFANAQSDQGDAFLALINSLPWKQVLDVAADKWTPLREGVNYISGKSSREKVEDVATIIYSPKTCSTCGASLQSSGVGQPATLSFKSGEKLTSFLFEYAQTDDAKKAGSFLIAFSHHSNLKDSKGEGQSIDIAQAIREDKGGKPATCGAVSKDTFFGIASLTPQQAGLLLTGGETIGYMAFGGTLGLFGSLTQQLVFAPKLQNCVDAEGGYYAHYFVANEQTSPGSKTAKELGSEKAGKLVDNAQQSFSDALTGIVSTQKQKAQEAAEQSPAAEGGQGVVKNAINELSKNTDELVAKVQQDNVLQATVQSVGTSNGHVNGDRLFWQWFSGENDLDVTKYDTTAITNLTTKDGSQIQINNQTGKITFFDKNTGKTTVLVDQADHTRLTSHNLIVPAEEIPARLNGVGLPGTATPMIDVFASGRSLVMDDRIADCFREASLKQTGVALNELDAKGNDLTPAFGRVTDVFTNVGTASPQETKIVMEGTSLSFTADSASSKIEILGNRETRIYGADKNAIPVGKMDSIHFENGIVVYKPETNELLIWLKHHGQAILSEKDVANLRGKLTNTINPNTKCSEPAIDLSALANPNSPESARKVDNFNKGLALNGPFQVFDTDKKTFILYSDQNCTPHFKIIDKETGEVYDQAIKNITQTDKGVQIQTLDGLTHDLEFGTQNGKPTLTYNGEEQILKSAQGKNGAFYFDPDKGLYYAENGQFLPLNDSFKSQGLSVKGNPDGSVTGNPGINIFNQGTQGGGANGGLFNLPTIPPQGGIVALVVMVALLTGFLILNERNNSSSTRKKKK